MAITRSMRGCGWARGVYVAALPLFFLFLTAGGARAAEVLFPAPLHITREVSGPFSDRTQVIDEYCHGNRVIAISGRRTAIADHAKREVTVIDFTAGTYSITKFEDIARAQQPQAAASLKDSRQDWTVEHRGGRVVASRPGESIEAQRKSDSVRQTVRVTHDRQITLSRAAAEALLGTSYPNPSSDAGQIAVNALRSRDKEEQYFLPLEYSIVMDVEGQSVETRNVVTRVGSELPPPDLVAIPPGARRVESDAVTARRLLEELDRPAAAQ